MPRDTSLDLRNAISSIASLQFPWPLGLKILQLPYYSVLDLWLVSSSIALLQTPWPFGCCKCFNCHALVFVYILVVSCPHAVLQFPWPLGCKFFNCFVTVSLAFGLSVLQLPCYSFLGLFVVSSSISRFQCPWLLGCSSSIALLQVPWPLVCKFFDRLATMSLTFGLKVFFSRLVLIVLTFRL